VSDQKPGQDPYIWHNPLSVWDDKDGSFEVPSIPVPDPTDIWRENQEFKVKTYKVGRLKHYHIWANHGQKTWARWRWWPTRRNMLHIKGLYNRKTLNAEKKILDRRPIYWVICLFLLAIAPYFFPDSMQNSLLTAGAIFGIYAAINVCWTLVIGTASIFSLASYAIVGVAAFITSWLSINYGLPWWYMPGVGMAIGLAFGGLIALPAMRLDGFYYALLTLGLNELCRVYFTTSKEFGSASGGLYGASTYINSDWAP